MKLNLSIFTGVASLAALMSGVFADTATTDPVGYVTTVVNPGAVATPSETFYGPTVTQKIEFAGTVLSKSAGKVLNFSGTPLTVPAELTGYQAFPLYYVEITNGSGVGMWTDVTGFTTSSITTADDLSLVVTDTVTTVKIRAHHTIGSLFGTANTSNFLVGDSVDSADELVLIDAALEGGLATIFFSNNEAPFDGWRDTNFADASKAVVAPGQGIKIKRKSAANLSVVTVGHVNTGPTVVAIQPGENWVAVPLSTGISLLNTGLGATTITKGEDIDSADNVQFQTGANAFTDAFFSTNDAPFDGWRDASFADVKDQLLKEGTFFNVKNNRGSTAAFNLTFPAQVIAP